MDKLKPFVRPSGNVVAVGSRVFPMTKQNYQVGDQCYFTDQQDRTINVGKVIGKDPSEKGLGWFNLTVEIIA